VRNPVCGLTLGRMQLEESGRDAEDWAKFHAHFAIAIERDYVRKRVVPIRKTALLGEGAAVQASVNLLFFFFNTNNNLLYSTRSTILIFSKAVSVIYLNNEIKRGEEEEACATVVVKCAAV